MIMSATYMYTPMIKSWTQQNPWMLLLSSIFAIINIFALIINRRSYPLNFYLLSSFTLLESHAIATICTLYDSRIVLQAVIITFAIFVGLTLFTFQTKYDFSSWQPYLAGSLWVLIIVSLVAMFLPFNSTLQVFMAMFSALLFCAYIVFDTQEIVKRLSPEEYIIASVELYLDIINLFIAILRILGDNRD
jgi:FtsH-binding integral membrane protein